MQMNVYQALASRTMDRSMSHAELDMHALHGMVAEIGELHGIFQKVYQGHAIDYEHVKKELGDVLWFLAEYCTSNGWMLEDIAKMNIDKLKARYPHGFDPARSLHRKEGDI